MFAELAGRLCAAASIAIKAVLYMSRLAPLSQLDTWTDASRSIGYHLSRRCHRNPPSVVLKP
jgi:hypothetical protein